MSEKQDDRAIIDRITNRIKAHGVPGRLAEQMAKDSLKRVRDREQK